MSHHTHDFEDRVRRLVHEFRTALEAGNPEAAADCWNVPALVLQDAGAHLIAARADAYTYARDRIEDVRLRGPGELKVRIETCERTSEHTAMADVVWSTPDASDKQALRYGVLELPSGRMLFCLAMPAPIKGAAPSPSDATLTGALTATFPASDPVAAITSSTPGAPDKRHST